MCKDSKVRELSVFKRLKGSATGEGRRRERERRAGARAWTSVDESTCTDSAMFPRGYGGPLNRFKQICIFESPLWLAKPLTAPEVPRFSAWLPECRVFHPARTPF